jgi:hypothetical protein
MQGMSELSTWAEINPLLDSMWKCQREWFFCSYTPLNK